MAEATATRDEGHSGRGLAKTIESGVRGFRGLPSGQQLGVLALGAAGLALIVGLLVWAMRPTFAPLTGPLPAGEASEVLRVLSQAGVPYRVDGATQAIEVPASRVAEARLLVAEQGLPSRGDFGFELLQQESGFGTSRLVESARFHRAIEGELARTIASLAVVESARVHIAQAERSVFIRERRPATASVVVHLARGGRLTDRQVDAIVHLVASSVPELEPERVTVVDQQGRLLTIDDPMSVGGEDQLQYQRRLEAVYVERVLALLEPIYGAGRVRVQVAADVDFSRIERTEERFDPDSAVARSEQLRDEERVGVDGLLGGVPGALTNQPPAGGAVANEAPAENGAAVQRPGSRVTEATRNFEIDRSIAHVREMPGAVRRVSTAVVVDFAETRGENGEVVRAARDAAELDQLRALVQEAVGFNAARGDTIQVVSAPFSLEEAAMVTSSQAWWREPWFVELLKVLVAALVALVVVLTVVRPAVRQLLASPERGEDADSGRAQAAARGGSVPALTMEPSAVAALTGPKGPDQQQLDLEAVREMVREDPKRVAQVIKAWVGDGDGK